MATDPWQLPFDKAIAYFLDKLQIPTERWDEIEVDLRDYAFTVAGVTNADFLTDLYKAVQSELDQGKGFQEFTKQVEPAIAQYGWRPDNKPWRLNLIFSQNITTAYAEGRRQQLDTPQMLRDRPYRMWRHRDSRDHRPAHKALDGKVFLADSDFYRSVRFPAGFGCKCGWFSLSEREMKQRGLSVSEPPADTLAYRDRQTGKTQRVPAMAIDGKLYPVVDPGFMRSGDANQNRQQVVEQLLERLDPKWRSQVEAQLSDRLSG
ncbi:MAG TPA: phage minor head protein [Coleofasciculaceae cyanobacterium]